jgi:hypothetical protein
MAIGKLIVQIRFDFETQYRLEQLYRNGSRAQIPIKDETDAIIGNFDLGLNEFYINSAFHIHDGYMLTLDIPDILTSKDLK